MNPAASIHAELVNLLLFFYAIGKVLMVTGLVAIVPLAAIDTWLLEDPEARRDH